MKMQDLKDQDEAIQAELDRFEHANAERVARFPIDRFGTYLAIYERDERFDVHRAFGLGSFDAGLSVDLQQATARDVIDYLCETLEEKA